MQRILTAEQMSFAEKASDSLGVSLWQLMKNAGTALAAHIEAVLKQMGGSRVTFICGSGNNGGDGFVAARLLAEKSYAVTAVLVKGVPKTELARRAFSELHDKVNVMILYEKALDTDVAVDCVFGTGFHGEFSEDIKQLFEAFNKSHAYKIACDMPSGINCRTGKAAVGTATFDETITFHAKKLGMCLKPAKLYCGRVTVCDIGIPDAWSLGCSDGTYIREMLYGDLHPLLPERPEYSHKGTFGKLLLICGSEDYIGAAAIASRAALHSGCGIVNLAAPKSVINAIAGQAPECVYTAVDTNEADCIKKLVTLANAHTAVVFGCGIGRTAFTQKLTEEIVRNIKVPIVIDADGINQLALNIDILKDRCSDSEIILTPHIAELSRLCGISVNEAAEKRYTICRELVRKYKIILHSKDSSSITFCGDRAYVTDYGCSALAKGGSGDMLAGVAGSMLAQGVSGENAVMLADFIVGKSAELICEIYSPRAVTATDIIDSFKISLNEL